MASTETGSKRGRWVKRGLALRGDNLPPIVALQALALFLFGFFLGAPVTDSRGSGASAIAGGDTRSVPADWEPQLPTDLRPERLPVPGVLELDQLAENEAPVPAPPSESSAEVPDVESEGARSSLSALRVASVSYRAPVAVTVALGVPDAPARLTPGTISQTGFGRGEGMPARSDGDGRGIDGVGIGIGGFGMGGGDCSRGSSRFPGIVERSHRIAY